MNLSDLRLSAVVFSLWIWLASCSLIEGTDKIIAPEWSPEVALPLVNTHISIEDALGLVDTEDYLLISPEGDLSLIYENGLTRITASDLALISIPNIPVMMPDSQVVIPFPVAQLNMIHLKSGVLRFDYQTAQTGSYAIHLALPQALNGGVPFSATFPVDVTGKGSVSYDLKGYSLAPAAGELTFSATIEDLSTGIRSALDDAQFLFKNLDYAYVEGQIPTYAYSSEKDSIHSNLLKGMTLKGLRLTNPSAKFIFDNSFGIPIEITALASFRGNDGHTVLPLGHDGLAGGVNLAYPALHEVGAFQRTEITLNQSNSNLADIVSVLPEYFAYQLGIVSNPNGNATSGFITDSSALSVSISAEVPLEGELEGLVLEETVEAELPDMDKIGAAGFKLIVENALPLEAAAQIYFLNEYDQVLDSLFEAYAEILPSPSTDVNGSVTNAGTQTFLLSFDEQRLAGLSSTQKIRISATISTAGGGQAPVKFRLSDAIGIKLGVITQIKPQ
ncbi:MAG: hypothetical protein R3C61_24785 [Bacteroidia bacterium]